MTLIYLIAGEQSGDVLGARLIAALRRRRLALQREIALTAIAPVLTGVR
jgi:lipid A disaccharide synthetase